MMTPLQDGRSGAATAAGNQDFSLWMVAGDQQIEARTLAGRWDLGSVHLGVCSSFSSSLAP